MIEVSPMSEASPSSRLVVMGLGGAGSNAVDRLHREGFWGAELCVANTDARALSAAATPTRLLLGQRLTRGLGAGGDPDLGRAAVEESKDAVLGAFVGAGFVIVLAGLGGGTGSGGISGMVQCAREQGAQVVVLATLPFSFEGKRRREQAEDSLISLRREADLVICFENDRMSSLVDAQASVEEAFGAVDGLMGQAVRSLVALTLRKGIVHSGIDAISRALAASEAHALFGQGIGMGEQRVQDALSAAFASPLFGGGNGTQGVSGVWVSLAGGADMRFAEVQSAMESVRLRFADPVRLFFGVAVDPDLSGSLCVTVLAGVLAGMEGGEQGRERAVASLPVSARSMERFRGETPLDVAVSTNAFSFTSDPSHPLGLEAESHEDAVASQSSWTEPEPAALDSEEVISEVTLERNEAVAWEEVDESVVRAEELPLPESSFVEKAQPDAASHSNTPRSVAVPPFESAAEMRRDVGAALLRRRVAERMAAEAQNKDSSAPREMREPREVHDELLQVAPPPPSEVSRSQRNEGNGGNEARSEKEPSSDERAHVSTSSGRAKGAPHQEQMHFEPVSRGRFEKTDPTVVDGQDLDVPTFLRQRMQHGSDSESH